MCQRECVSSLSVHLDFVFIELSLKCVVLENDDSLVDKHFDWIEVSSPARLDLAGAWSDTPPICYECVGSCVTNVSVLVNGTKPIGSKGEQFCLISACLILEWLSIVDFHFVARIFKPSEFNVQQNFIRIVLKDSGGNDLLLTFDKLTDFSNYNRPEA
jgi:hypothetical protein